jgi:hypothetical protein
MYIRKRVISISANDAGRIIRIRALGQTLQRAEVEQNRFLR